jgi:DNA-binding HxlR family transcriptional regulator
MATATKSTIGCVQAATDILGDKWTPGLLRAIHNDGQAGFCRLQEDVGGINPRTLSARLTRLEEQGIITRCEGASAHRECYTLSQKGEALMPILDQMAEWGKQFTRDTV